MRLSLAKTSYRHIVADIYFILYVQESEKIGYQLNDILVDVSEMCDDVVVAEKTKSPVD